MPVNNSASPALLVFGASGALGRALVHEAQGKKQFDCVAACSFRNQPKGDLNFQFDIFNLSELETLPGKLAKKNLRVSAIVNCIGASRDKLLPQTSLKDWNEVIDLNLRSSFLIARSFLQFFIFQRRGHFVFIGSHAGQMGRAGQCNYAAAKAALIGMTQAIAREYGKRNIQANVVLPGFLPDSPMVKKLSKPTLTRLQSENTLGHPSNCEEVAGFILHLLSMKRVSGQVFALDSRILPQ